MPILFGGFSYGTCKITFAVWYGGLKASEEIKILGFGQIVAIGLLALTMLGATAISDDKSYWSETSILLTSRDRTTCS